MELQYTSGLSYERKNCRRKLSLGKWNRIKLFTLVPSTHVPWNETRYPYILSFPSLKEKFLWGPKSRPHPPLHYSLDLCVFLLRFILKSSYKILVFLLCKTELGLFTDFRSLIFLFPGTEDWVLFSLVLGSSLHILSPLDRSVLYTVTLNPWSQRVAWW